MEILISFLFVIAFMLFIIIAFVGVPYMIIIDRREMRKYDEELNKQFMELRRYNV